MNNHTNNLQVLAVQDLQPGMVITRVVAQQGPVKVSKSGLVTSRDMVQGLQEMGIQQVEIDTDQTVQIESSVPEVAMSATQKMLTGSMQTNAQADQNLSNQFHRSLFVPSVNDLPNQFQFYAKQYRSVVVVAVLGLILGWGLGRVSPWLNVVQNDVNNTAGNTVNNTAKNSPVEPLSQPVVAAIDSPELAKPADTSAAATDPASQTPQTVNPPVAQVTAVQTATPQAPMPQMPVSQTPAPETSLPPVPTEVEPSAAPVVAQNQQTPPPAQISNELLSKFNRALQEVSEQPESESDAAQQSAASSADSTGTVRVDQLPVWVLTELPSMAFSAHMYASVSEHRWVRVNNVKMVEGDVIDGKVQIKQITPQHVILNYAGHDFSMSALTDW